MNTEHHPPPRRRGRGWLIAALATVLVGAFGMQASSTWLLAERYNVEPYARPFLILMLEVGAITGAALYLATADKVTRRSAGLLVVITSSVGTTGGVERYGVILGAAVGATLLLLVHTIGRYLNQPATTREEPAVAWDDPKPTWEDIVEPAPPPEPPAPAVVCGVPIAWDGADAITERCTEPPGHTKGGCREDIPDVATHSFGPEQDPVIRGNWDAPPSPRDERDVVAPPSETRPLVESPVWDVAREDGSRGRMWPDGRVEETPAPEPEPERRPGPRPVRHRTRQQLEDAGRTLPDDLRVTRRAGESKDSLQARVEAAEAEARQRSRTSA